ncbi:MAG: hypothetical protein AAB578_09640 [Elusimicrobiota bacterium]
MMRPISFFPLLSALLAVFVLAQETTKAPRLKLISLTGSIEVESGGKKAVFSGADLPPDLTIAPGSRVRILSGQAVFSDGKIALSAPTGADFTVQDRSSRERERAPPPLSCLSQRPAPR